MARRYDCSRNGCKSSCRECPLDASVLKRERCCGMCTRSTWLPCFFQGALPPTPHYLREGHRSRCLAWKSGTVKRSKRSQGSLRTVLWNAPFFPWRIFAILVSVNMQFSFFPSPCVLKLEPVDAAFVIRQEVCASLFFFSSLQSLLTFRYFRRFCLQSTLSQTSKSSLHHCLFRLLHTLQQRHQSIDRQSWRTALSPSSAPS